MPVLGRPGLGSVDEEDRVGVEVRDEELALVVDGAVAVAEEAAVEEGIWGVRERVIAWTLEEVSPSAVVLYIKW